MEKIKSNIIVDCLDLIDSIEEYTKGGYCLQCKFFTLCEKDYNYLEWEKSNFLKQGCESYKKYFKKRQKIVNQKITENFFKQRIEYFKNIIIDIENIQEKYLKIKEMGIEIKNNLFLKNALSNEKINYYFTNTKLYKGEAI